MTYFARSVSRSELPANSGSFDRRRVRSFDGPTSSGVDIGSAPCSTQCVNFRKPRKCGFG
jgi:hypothetical protein